MLTKYRGHCPVFCLGISVRIVAWPLPIWCWCCTEPVHLELIKYFYVVPTLHVSLHQACTQYSPSLLPGNCLDFSRWRLWVLAVFLNNLISSIIHSKQPKNIDSVAPSVSNSPNHQIKCQLSFFQMISQNSRLAPLTQHWFSNVLNGFRCPCHHYNTIIIYTDLLPGRVHW